MNKKSIRQNEYIDSKADLSLFYDDAFVDFYVIDINDDTNQITVVVSNLGKITQQTFDLQDDRNGQYFEYGIYRQKVYL